MHLTTQPRAPHVLGFLSVRSISSDFVAAEAGSHCKKHSSEHVAGNRHFAHKSSCTAEGASLRCQATPHDSTACWCMPLLLWCTFSAFFDSFIRTSTNHVPRKKCSAGFTQVPTFCLPELYVLFGSGCWLCVTHQPSFVAFYHSVIADDCIYMGAVSLLRLSPRSLMKQ